MDLAQLMQDAYGQECLHPGSGEMIDFIMSNLRILTRDETIEVARYLDRSENGSSLLTEVAAGLMIDLSKLPQNILEVVYDMFVDYKKKAGSAESIEIS